MLLSPVVVARWADHIASDATPDWVFPLTGVVFVGFVVFHLFRYMLLAPRVNTEVLCTGVAMFLTLAMWWAFAYVLVGQLIPDSFAYTTGKPDDQHMQGFIAIYFSLVTLCTVGFGDIVPVSGPARMLAMLEGVTGVFYVAIMVARLVSIDLSLTIDPTPANGCTKRCYALSHCVATTSAKRLTPTDSAITPEQLRAIRRQIGLAIGLA